LHTIRGAESCSLQTEPVQLHSRAKFSTDDSSY
jgi:hypothetical protein